MLLVTNLRRHETDARQHRLHRLVGRAGAKHDAVEFLLAAITEDSVAQLADRAGAALRRADKNRVEVGVGFLGDEVLPLADIGPADDLAVGLGDKGRSTPIVNEAL